MERRRRNPQKGYILVIVDVYSRYAWAFPLITKQAKIKDTQTLKDSLEH